MIFWEKLTHIIKDVKKPMRLVITPLAFAFILTLILFVGLNLTVGDVIGYGSVLFMKSNDYGQYDAENIFEPSTKESGTVNIKDVTFPSYERVYGEIEIATADIHCPLIYGDSERALWRGACQYIGSTIVGYGGTTIIAAHVNRHFKTLNEVKVNDYIKVTTTYGTYVYKVNYTGVHSATDNSAYDLKREDENIVLYTCYYEKTSFGSVKKRFFVCGDYISGPMIDKEVTE